VLYNTIGTARELKQEFMDYNRDYYSLEAYEAILDYFDNIDENVELDVIGLCCDFNEDTLDEIIGNYNIEIEDEENKEEEVMDYLQKHTWAVRTTDNKILYTVF
jgi:hypothetical protein